MNARSRALAATASHRRADVAQGENVLRTSHARGADDWHVKDALRFQDELNKAAPPLRRAVHHSGTLFRQGGGRACSAQSRDGAPVDAGHRAQIQILDLHRRLPGSAPRASRESYAADRDEMNRKIAEHGIQLLRHLSRTAQVSLPSRGQ